MVVKKIIQFWKSAFVTAVILYLSFAPSVAFKNVPSFENDDKLVHVFMYFGLTIILIFDFLKSGKKSNINQPKFVLVCLIYPAIFGGLIEILQPIIAFPRAASWFDWIADLIGVLIAWRSMRLIYKSLTEN